MRLAYRSQDRHGSRGKTPLQHDDDAYVDHPHHDAFGDRFHSLEHDDAAPSTVRYTGSESPTARSTFPTARRACRCSRSEGSWLPGMPVASVGPRLSSPNGLNQGEVK